jgi:hypothetical protein
VIFFTKYLPLYKPWLNRQLKPPMAKLHKYSGRDNYFVRDAFSSGGKSVFVTYQLNTLALREFERRGLKDGSEIPDNLFRSLKESNDLFTGGSGTEGVEEVRLDNMKTPNITAEFIPLDRFPKTFSELKTLPVELRSRLRRKDGSPETIGIFFECFGIHNKKQIRKHYDALVEDCKRQNGIVEIESAFQKLVGKKVKRIKVEAQRLTIDFEL